MTKPSAPPPELTPPPELVQQWIPTGWNCSPNTFTTLLMRIADNAALWSHDHCRSKIKAATDQELEACVNWLIENQNPRWAHALRIARRPKPPSLKEKALAVITNAAICDHLSPEDEAILRRALEALPND